MLGARTSRPHALEARIFSRFALNADGTSALPAIKYRKQATWKATALSV
jgi:hypothetical protein